MIKHKGESSAGFNNGLSGNNEMSKQQLIEAIINNNDGWSMPFFNGKPLKQKRFCKTKASNTASGPR